jgi:hypothetical protein
MGREHQDIDSWSDRASCAFDIVTGEFVVVTADAADLQVYRPMSALLNRMRKAFGLEAAFIAQWADGEPVARRAAGAEAGSEECDSLHATYGRRLLESAADREPGRGDADRFDAAPVITSDGFEYGTLCCRRIVSAGGVDDGAQEEALRSVARLIADWFEEAKLSLSGLMPLPGESVMGGLPLMSAY